MCEKSNWSIFIMEHIVKYLQEWNQQHTFDNTVKFLNSLLSFSFFELFLLMRLRRSNPSFWSWIDAKPGGDIFISRWFVKQKLYLSALSTT